MKNSYCFDYFAIPDGVLPQKVESKAFALPLEEEQKQMIINAGMNPNEQKYYRAILPLGAGSNVTTYHIANSECGSSVTFERPEGRRGLIVTINDCAGCLLSSECAFIPGGLIFGEDTLGKVYPDFGIPMV